MRFTNEISSIVENIACLSTSIMIINFLTEVLYGVHQLLKTVCFGADLEKNLQLYVQFVSGKNVIAIISSITIIITVAIIIIVIVI